jgi:SAM-dependent methyltransferase
MDDYGASTYGDRIAGIYDDWYGEASTEMISRLAEFAGDGPVLELGIGTGRAAIPLAGLGIPVHGVDASSAMLDRLRSKPGAASIDVTVADFGDFDLGQRFSLVFVVANTFFSLLDQESQVGCFQRAAQHLLPDGRFLLEAFVPDLSRFDRDQRVSATRLEPDTVVIDATMHNPAEQRVDSQHMLFTEDGVKLHPVALRYAWPSELDLMARLAGLRLEHRWGGWGREPFTSTSGSHVSVYQAA